MINISINTDNTAFQDPLEQNDLFYRNTEVIRILEKVIEHLQNQIDNSKELNRDNFALLDINGNIVGQYQYDRE